MLKSLWIGLSSALCLISCAKTSSDNIRTSGFYASYTIRGNNQNSVDCSASFQVSAGGTYIDLNSGDNVTCNGNTMSRSEFAGIITYSAVVPFQVGGTYTVTLTRTGESAYSSSAILPEAIAGVSPSAGTWAKGTPLTVSWIPSSNTTQDYLGVSFSSSNSSSPSPCPNLIGQTDSAPEQGSLGWSSSDTSSPTSTAGSCVMTMKLLRSRTGSMATALSGTIVGQQETSVALTFN